MRGSLHLTLPGLLLCALLWDAATPALAQTPATSLPGGSSAAPAPSGGTGPSEATAPADAAAAQPVPDAAAGLATFREHCADCHGAFGRGDGSMVDRLPAPPPSFADAAVVGRSSPDAALEIITNGRIKRLMPPWKDKLSADERAAALYGAWSFYYTPERLVAGRTAWDKSCTTCHGQKPGATGSPAFDADWWRSRSQDDVATAWRAAAVHGALSATGADLRSALDYARADSFKALPYQDLQADGSITGRVVNGSADAAGVAGATVSLIPFHEAVPGILPGRPISETLKADGAFRFAGLLRGPGLNYHVLTRYQGADTIAPEPIALGGGSPTEATLQTKVYEASAEVPVRASLVQMILAARPEDGQISVAEAWTLVNDSDRTRIGAPGKAVLSFKVPATAGQIAFDDPGQQAAATVTEGALQLDYPLPPGEHTVLFSYSLPYAGRSLVLDSRPPVAVERFELMAVGPEVSIESDRLGAMRREQRGENSIAVVLSDNLAEGTAWTARLTELPEPTADAPAGPVRLRAWGPTMEGGSWLGLGVIALVLLLLGLNLDRKRRQAAFRRAGDRLVAAIAALDKSWQQGDLGEGSYRRQRAALVATALALPDGATDGTPTPRSAADPPHQGER